MGAVEKIKEMIEAEIMARDAIAVQIAGTDDAIQLTALIADYGCRCAAIGALLASIDEIEKEANK